MMAAVAWGADSTDPRLNAACDRFLETEHGDGGFAGSTGRPTSAVATARMLQTLGELRFCRHLRFQEALAWFEEEPTAWPDRPRERCTTATALLATLAACPELRRDQLRSRLAEILIADLGETIQSLDELGHPNLQRTDLAEILWALARSGVPYDDRMADPLLRLQRAQMSGGRWPRRYLVPRSLPLEPSPGLKVGEASRWITLRATVAMHAYAVEAGLPRLFPTRPNGKQ